MTDSGDDRSILRVNPAAQRILGRTEDEIIGTRLSDYEDRGNVEASGSYEQLASGDADQVEYERTILRPDGEQVLVKVTAAAVRDETGQLLRVIRMMESITEQRATTSSLLASETRFRTLFESAPLGIGLIDNNRNLMQVNPLLGELLGVEPASLVGTRLQALFAAESTECGIGAWPRLLSGEVDSYFEERQLATPPAGVEWLSIATSAVRDETGEFLFAIVAVSDVTEQKQAEQQLQASESQFRSLFEEAPLAIATMDIDSGFTAGNAAWESMFGFTVDEMKGYKSTDFLSPEHVRRGRGALAKVLSGEIPFEQNE